MKCVAIKRKLYVGVVTPTWLICCIFAGFFCFIFFFIRGSTGFKPLEDFVRKRL